MKTLDAFAFRDFDPTRILQRPYFRKFGFANETDEKILSDLAVTDSDDVKTMELKNSRAYEIWERLQSFRKFLLRHSNLKDGRLTEFRYAVAKSLPPNYDIQLARALQLSKTYFLEVIPAVDYLSAAVNKTCRNSAKSLQEAYKRQFGCRLRQARERAKLTRADLGGILNIAPNSYGLYETGRNDVTATALRKLSQILNVSADWLLGLE